jgi:O-antigen/teichoic acid export membrane protein
MVSFSFSLIIFLSLTIALSSYFYQVEIMGWMRYPFIQESAPIFATLMFCFIPISTTYIFGTLLTANGSLKQLNIMAAFGMVLNISLNIMIIPRFQAQGAAFVSLFTQTITAIAQVIIATKVFHFKPRWNIILKVIFFGLLLIVLGYLSKYITKAIVGYLVYLIVATLAAFMIGLIDLKSLINLVLKRE